MFETRNELEGFRWTGEIHINFLLFCFCFWIQGRTFGQNRTNFCSHLMSTLNLAGRYYPYIFIFTQQPCRFIVCSLQPFSCRSQQFNSSLICAMPTHRRDKRARSRSPVALRPKSAPHSHSDRWTHRESNRQPETSRPQTPFNVFAQETKPTRGHSPHTDDSTTQQKVVLRSNSETKREREHHRSDLTSWKTLTVPSHDTAHIPDWARPSAQDIALPSSSSQIQTIAPPQMPTNRDNAPPLSILSRNNGDQIINVHGEPPEGQKQWYLEVIRSVCPSSTPNPFLFSAPQQAKRPRTVADQPPNSTPMLQLPAGMDFSSNTMAHPLLQLPLPAQSLSDSTDADPSRLSTAPVGTSHFEIQVGNNGMTKIGTDNQAMQIRFLTEQEARSIKLPKSSTYVPWANMSVIEFKHHQSHESGMQNIWCPSPYCWLLSEQLLFACKHRSNKDDVWLRLWHYLDTMKQDANQSTNRLVAAHELSLQISIHHHPVDLNLRQQIQAKIVNNHDVSSWTTQMQMLEHIFSNWTGWQNQVHLILPQIEEKTNTPVLMIFYNWQSPSRSYSNNKDLIAAVQTYPWGHATDINSGIQIVNTGGIRPAATIDESDNIYHWSPSFYCRVNGNLVDNKIDNNNYITIATRSIFHCRKKSPNQQRPITFHGIAYARQKHLTIGSGGTAAEFSASLFFDVVHGHQNRWLIKCHISTLLGFAV